MGELIKMLGEERRNVEFVEATNLFKVSDNAKFMDIVNRIDNDEVLVNYVGDYVSLCSLEGTLCTYMPSNEQEENELEYNTLFQLQKILTDDSKILLSSYIKSQSSDIIYQVYKVTKDKIELLCD